MVVVVLVAVAVGVEGVGGLVVEGVAEVAVVVAVGGGVVVVGGVVVFGGVAVAVVGVEVAVGACLVSVVVAEIVMQNAEEQALASYSQTLPLWIRYVHCCKQKQTR